MKKSLSLFVALCFVHAVFSQVKVNSVGNTGMGAAPNSKAKLLLNSTSAVTDTVFGIHTSVSNTNSSLSKPMYGGYFKNTQTGDQTGSSAPLHGIYIENNNSKYVNSTYGVYTNNNISGYANTTHGYYVNNTGSGYSGTMYGFYANNTANHGYSGNLYGIYLMNNKPSSVSGDVYGIYSTNSSKSTQGGNVYGAYLSATSPITNGVYGIYSVVSGGSANSRYSGYFTGGKVLVDDDIYANLDVYARGVKLTSDERLKSDIKPLADEKDKLYLLQGKSYKKSPLPIVLEDSMSIALKAEMKKESIENDIAEFGYLAQELKEIFPDLVSQNSNGYYAVNYIGLIPVIVEALKEQRSENEKQSEQIRQLAKLMSIKSINEKAFEENGIESIPLLLQNTPNPFNKATEIGYYIPETINSANIYIYDINGFQQRNISISERGKGVTILQATALQAGIYFYTLICDGKPVDTKQMILTR